MLLGCVLVACVPAVDAPIPPGYDGLVNGARASLRQNQEGLFPPRLSFSAIRCFANGAHVVVFREVGGDHSGAVAFAMQGPAAQVDAWSGGFGEAAMDEELAFSFGGVAEVPCPPR